MQFHTFVRRPFTVKAVEVKAKEVVPARLPEAFTE